MFQTQTRSVGGLQYTLVRKKVKNINLRVRPDGTVAASAPARVRAETVDAFVAAHANWVAEARARLTAHNEQLAAQPLPDRRAALELFTRLTLDALPLFAADPRVPKPPVVKVRDMSTRWGVCHMAKGTITYALRLYNMPPAAREYVVIHELCHFLVGNHSPAFWAEVQARLPDWKQRRRLLRRE